MVVPETLEDVVQTVRACHAYRAPVLCRGGGTSLSGETVNVAVVIDFSKYLTDIIDVDPQRRLATVQTGVINEQLNKATGQYGLVFGPDPSSHSRCTLGGNIGNNSCGVHSIQSHLYWRPRDLSAGNYPQVPSGCLSNYTSDPVFRAKLQPGEDATEAAVRKLPIFGGPFRWEDLEWLRSETELPLMAKGICHPDDIRRAKDIGVDGIYCSNHGGRQANGGLPALDCLPAVLEAADGLPVLFDSGVRSGADIIKALAMGATGVGIGRPYCYGVALGGVDGIVHVLRSLLAEADLIMAVDGYPSLKDLTPDTLRPTG